ncbi:MAG: hypothetical protein EBQ89_07115 [Alphaproteobacteria bacterium]|nr:hypothetical protein [Alphaproteobacteria bacterium]
MTYVPRHPTDGQAPRAPTGFRMMDVAAQLSRSLPLGANLNAGAITSSTTPGQCELRRVMDTAGGTPASLTTTYRVPTQAGICLAQPGSVAVFTLL